MEHYDYLGKRELRILSTVYIDGFSLEWARLYTGCIGMIKIIIVFVIECAIHLYMARRK